MLRACVRVLVLTGALAVAAPCAAQDRPFVFSITTSEASTNQAVVYLDSAFGEHPFNVSGEAGAVQQVVGVQASIGQRWTILADAGFAPTEQVNGTTVHSELLVSILSGPQHGISLAAGGGVRHEWSGIDVLIGRVTAGKTWSTSRLAGNVVFEHPIAAVGRDALDLTTTVGWTARVSRAVSVGVEGIGEDLEGFWDPDEAEGGARMLVGPSLHVAGAKSKWQVTVTGGPLFHVDANPRSSDATRLLPPQQVQTGYAVRGSVAFAF